MPVSDQCSFELDANLKALQEAAEICVEANELMQDLLDEIENTEKDCMEEAEPRPRNIPGETDNPFMEPMDIHDLEREWEEYREKVRNCLDSHGTEDMWNDYKNLEAACEIAMEEAEAIADELEACLHALHEGIPFA